MPHCKYLTNGLYELRVRAKQEVRIFYFFSGNRAYFILGFIKKTQKIPLKQLRRALAIKKYLTSS